MFQTLFILLKTNFSISPTSLMMSPTCFMKFQLHRRRADSTTLFALESIPKSKHFKHWLYINQNLTQKAKIKLLNLLFSLRIKVILIFDQIKGILKMTWCEHFWDHVMHPFKGLLLFQAESNLSKKFHTTIYCIYATLYEN